MERPKRRANANVAVAPDDMERVDLIIDSVPFPVSRSVYFCVSVRLTNWMVNLGLVSLESLFQMFFKEPLQPLSPFDLARAAQITILLARYIQATRLNAIEAVLTALLLGLRSLERFDWVEASSGEAEERMSA